MSWFVVVCYALAVHIYSTPANCMVSINSASWLVLVLYNHALNY